MSLFDFDLDLEVRDIALLYGVVSRDNPESRHRCAALFQEDDNVLDLALHCTLDQRYQEYFGIDFSRIFAQPSLNEFAALPVEVRDIFRRGLICCYKNDLIPPICFMKKYINHLPMDTRECIHFYGSEQHTLLSANLRGEEMPDNLNTSPVYYNGCPSSLVVTEELVHRPHGITRDADNNLHFGPTQKLDFEMEVGFYISKSWPRGRRLPLEHAIHHIFGFVLLNDWTARDMEDYERKPLGPSQSKDFATSVSAWITPLDTLTECIVTQPMPPGEDTTIEHLRFSLRHSWTIDMELMARVYRLEDDIDVAVDNKMSAMR